MIKFVGLILIVVLVFPLTGAAGFDAANMNPQSQVHNIHIGQGTVGLGCDTCHGFPPNVIQVQNGSGPGNFIVCEKCHAPPPESMKPSNGNLIVIHLSRNTYCTNCHGADFVTIHSSVKVDINTTTGTVGTSKCESCHRNPQQFTSHVNGGKYCLDCHGNMTTPLIIAISPTSTPLAIPVSTYVTSAARVKILIVSQRGFVSATQTINTGDEVIWRNDGKVAVTLASSNGLFDNQILEFDKEYRYTFNKPGTYSFYMDENKNLKGTVIVSGAESSSASPVSTQVSTYAAPTVKQRAQLQVTYEVGAGRTREELTISVHLKNIGNATASKVNLTIENPPDLQAAVLSGSEQVGNIITWNGEIEPRKEHIAQYAVKIVAGRDIEVPLKVTYVKISQEEKARELGISSVSSAEVNTAFAPEEIELITLVMKIALSAVPGFEGIMAIILVLSAGSILRKRGR
ncbi:MAG: hypothetical protein Q7J35_02415 [Candidatus Methanoperedens sp.]|nr:hypothetical protein [Candidatus Methanoperedens sp.]